MLKWSQRAGLGNAWSLLVSSGYQGLSVVDWLVLTSMLVSAHLPLCLKPLCITCALLRRVAASLHTTPVARWDLIGEAHSESLWWMPWQRDLCGLSVFMLLWLLPLWLPQQWPGVIPHISSGAMHTRRMGLRSIWRRQRLAAFGAHTVLRRRLIVRVGEVDGGCVCVRLRGSADGAAH